jgi:AcrR family transcriptional regulator
VGFEGASLREIAARAGTTHGLVRHHFGSKEGVWRAVVHAANAEYWSALAPLIARGVEHDAALGTVKEVLRNIILVAARHPQTVRLLMHEGVKGGARLDYILGRIAPQRALMGPLYLEVRRRGFLRGFDNEAFFLFVITAGAMPFALAGLTGRLYGTDVLTEEQAGLHADRIIATVFGGQPTG